MKKRLVFLLFLLRVLAFPTQGIGQDETSDSTSEAFLLTLNQDNVFGFNPAVYGSFGLGKDGVSEGVSLTYYSIFWTNPSFGTLFDGSDLWLETGVGLGFTGLSERLFLNPSLGLTHGRVLSDSPRGAFAEGIVPSITALFKDGMLEGELYFSYYKALQNKGSNSGDYLLYWILPGVRVSKRFALGMHFERFERIRHARGDTGKQYVWLGGYIKFNLSDRYTFRFSGGVNDADNGIYGDSFYKLNVAIALPGK